jgi:RNA polymerase sigma-70 factor (ECF subfamily)
MLETQGESELLSQESITPVIDREELILEANERIIEELTHLPDADRALLLAVHLNHRPYDDLALELHIPVGTVKSRIFRARKMLKDRLPSLIEIEEDCETKHYAALVA